MAQSSRDAHGNEGAATGGGRAPDQQEASETGTGQGPGGAEGAGGPQRANEDPSKDPDTWVTGDEPMTGPQASYLQTLARESGEDVPDDMTKAEASKKIDELRERTGRQ